MLSNYLKRFYMRRKYAVSHNFMWRKWHVIGTHKTEHIRRYMDQVRRQLTRKQRNSSTKYDKQSPVHQYSAVDF